MHPLTLSLFSVLLHLPFLLQLICNLFIPCIFVLILPLLRHTLTTMCLPSPFLLIYHLRSLFSAHRFSSHIPKSFLCSTPFSKSLISQGLAWLHSLRFPGLLLFLSPPLLTFLTWFIHPYPFQSCILVSSANVLRLCSY